jgi:hypothetical protein
MDHVVDEPERTVTGAESEDDLARVTISTALQPGERLRVVKFLAYGWSSRRSLPAMRDQVDAALAAAVRIGWDGLRESQRDYLDDFWARADVELDGDPALQQAIRFGALRSAAVGGARRGPRDPGEGVDRPRLRRSLLLGHGDLHAAGPDVHRADRGARRAAEVLVMATIWLSSWFAQSVTGWSDYDSEQLAHGEHAHTYWQFLGTAHFWEGTLQNWQSEFLAVGTMAVLAIYLRQRGSPESKPVGAAHSATGTEG